MTGMAFWLYILKCTDEAYYTGHTDDLEARIAAHRSGVYAGFTRRRRPVIMVFSEEFPTRDEAFAAERQIKGWSRAKKEALIAGDWGQVSKLAQRPR